MIRNSHRFGRRTWILAAAIAAVPLFSAATAHAQYRSNNDGHALDANSRAGSGGYNNSVDRGSPVTANQITYGNVTGLSYFHGPVGSTDPLAFRGNTGSFESDRFIATSSGAATRAQVNNTNNFNPQPFYGENRGVAPPPGFVPLSYSGGYVPSDQYTMNQGFNLNRMGGPASLSSYGSPYQTQYTNERLASQLGTHLIPGSVDVQAGGPQNYLLASSLAGIRQVSPADLSIYFNSANAPADRFRTDPLTIEQLRRELEQQVDSSKNGTGMNRPLDNTIGGQNPNGQQNNNGAQNPNGPQNPNAAPNQNGRPLINGALPNAVQQPFEKPINQTLQQGNYGSEISGAQPLNSGVQTNEGIRRQLVGLPPPSQQSTQYKELEARLKQYRQSDETAEEQELQFQRALAITRGGRSGGSGAAAAPGRTAPGGAAPGTAAPGTRTPATGAGSAVPSGTTPPRPGTAVVARPVPGQTEARPAPVVITSLATGVQAHGLATILKAAEDEMKQGKFASALDQYDLAEQVAPNNSLIALGKANAELGASSYRSADAHIRQAFAADRVLLMGRYDLKSFLGADRLQILTSDLQDLAKNNPQDPMPPFLLGYIAYNNGNKPQTVAYLNDAEKREGRPDPVIRLMREYWGLNGPGGTTPAVAPSPAPAPAAAPAPASPPAPRPTLNK